MRSSLLQAVWFVWCCCVALVAEAARAQGATPTLRLGCVGLHGGVFEALRQHAPALAIDLQYLSDERLARREADLDQFQIVLVQHLRDDTAAVLVAAAARRPEQAPLRLLALSGGGGRSAGSERRGLEQDPQLQAYYGSSPENLRRLLVYVLATYGGRELPIEPPLPKPRIGIFHPELPGSVDLAAFEAFLAAKGPTWATRPRVAVVAHDIHLQLQQAAVVEALVRGLEAKGLAACAVLDCGEGLQRFRADYERLLLELRPAAVVHTCHAVDEVPFRMQLDVPHLHSIFLRRQSIAEWRQDPVGLPAHELVFQVASQETLGAIEPQIGAGTEAGGGDAAALVPIAERIDHLVRRTAAHVALRTTPAAAKRVAVIYYASGADLRGLARGSATGMFLNGPQSLVALLQRLSREGYAVADAPGDEDSLLERLRRGGRQLLPTQTRELSELVAHGAPALVPVATFKHWLDTKVPPAARKQLEERWGPPPGRFMVWTDAHGATFLVVPHVDYGNVTLLPQPLRGEANDAQTAHDKHAAPPYNYLATYFWLQEQWRAHALVHFGTHGSDIALPGKATGLCEEDWTDLCMGALPNVYPWIVENLGEAPAAKRRSYGILIGHLPPPLANAGLDAERQALHDDLEKCLAIESGALRERFRQGISTRARALRLDRELGVVFPPDGPLDDAALQALDAALHRLLEEPIPTSLHTLGEVPSDAELVPHLVTCLHRAFLDRLAALWPAAAAGGHSEHLRGVAEAVVRAVAVESVDPAAALAAAGVPVPATGVPEALAADLATAKAMRAGYLASGAELDGVVRALGGRFVAPGPGRGPDRNPAVLPTGRNLYLLNQDEVPSRASWELGKQLAEQLLADWQAKSGRLPQKIAFALNAGATFQDYGVQESQILCLLGAEPVWNERGLVKEVRILPRAELGRPRIDVMIAAGARYHSVLPSRLELIERTVRAVQELNEADNGLRAGTAAALAELRRRGLDPDTARRLAAARIFGFGGSYGDAGTRFSFLVERSADWDRREELMEEYLARERQAFVGGEFTAAPRAAFETALRGTEVVLRTWARGTESPLANRYQWLHGGALAAAVEHVTGVRPEYRLVDVRDPDRAENVDATTALRRDFRVRLFHRPWIAAMQREGYAGADQVAVHVGNAFGWATMQRGAVTKESWDEVVEVYLDDRLGMGMAEWFQRENPHALQAITATLLDASRKGFWAADAATLAKVAARHLELVAHDGPNGGLRDAGTGKLRAYAQQVLGAAAGTAAAGGAPGSPQAVPAVAPREAVPSAAPQAPLRERVVGQRLEPVPSQDEAPIRPWDWPWAALVAVGLVVVGFLRGPRR